MTFTKEQLSALEKYEAFFSTAVRSNWARNPGLNALTEIHSIYTIATKDTRHLNASCQSCILSLLRDCGTLFFADRQEMIDAENDSAMVEMMKKEVKRKPRKK